MLLFSWHARQYLQHPPAQKLTEELLAFVAVGLLSGFATGVLLEVAGTTENCTSCVGTIAGGIFGGGREGAVD